MVHFDLDGVQNVEVSKKLPSHKTAAEQLSIMEQYTATHRQHLSQPREQRELACLRVQYPALLVDIQPQDLIAGRIDVLPIGFGCVTSLGGVGHFCVFNKLRAFQRQLAEPADRARVDVLYDYWALHDLKTLYCREALTETTVGRFIDTEYPMIATARLSGMMLDYEKLLSLGIDGLRAEIHGRLLQEPENEFLQCALGGLALFAQCADAYAAMAEEQLETAQGERRAALLRIRGSMHKIRTDKPETFHQALQLFWLYALVAGVINYGRLDDFLGPYLARDLQTGELNDAQAFDLMKSLWTMIENRRTTVNGRIIVGGQGRKHPAEADVFLHLAMRVARQCRYVEPQFTLRFDSQTPDAVWDEAMDALGAGATYPTLYNDDVNVPAVAYGMRVDMETAKQYVPFGCTEFVIQGQSTGTPNICINLLKLLTVYLNGGIDPMDGKRKDAGVAIPPPEATPTYEALFAGYAQLVNAYLDLAVDRQMASFRVMNEHVSFLMMSMLTDDCIARGKAILDGGVRYLGATNETYGNINTSDSLYAIKKLVFEQKRYTLAQVAQALRDDFNGHDALRAACLACDKYGNDLDTCDSVANDVYELVAKGTRDRGIAAGMQYFLIVISNNQLNTEWGLRTGASPDGRLRGVYLNPANNPQGGANTSGPTAMLNSLRKFDPRYHAGSVQNIKFTPTLFNENRAMVKGLMKTYFDDGGCHLMVTVVNRGELEDAMAHPEKYPDLIVRVSGFSAVFVNLDRAIQEELLSRVLYGEVEA